MLRRAVVVLSGLAVTIGIASLAEARSTSAYTAAHQRTRHMLREKETQTTLSSSGNRSINLAILDGKIGGKSVHGAARAISIFSSPTTGTGKRTEFDQYGSRTASLTFNVVINPDGSRTGTGRGHWTGGTGRYKGATGSFTIKGTIPAGSSTFTAIWKGTIVY